MNDILLKYNRPGPRYTSYPPANFFNSEFTDEAYRQAVVDSNKEQPENVSLYIHIPFCSRLCHFCGCNTGIAKEKNHIRLYIDALLKEIRTVSPWIDKNRPVTQVHWGGGTPNSIPMEFIGEVMDELRKQFRFHGDAEVAMECSPAHLTVEDVSFLAKTGFNRISLGVQDFHNEVLRAVNRLPSQIPLRHLFAHIRALGFRSINLDLIYGLPRQTPELFADNIRQALQLMPDRLVTFSYAHVPWVNKAMEKLERIGLPTAEEKFALFGLSYDMLTKSGYEAIGLDHYAQPGDDLAIAAREKKLHRNFQGYCTRETTGQVYAFGSSGISQLWNSYSQNAKNYVQYMTAIEAKGTAVERGYRLNRQEIITREVINAVMCNGMLDFRELAERFEMTVPAIRELLKFTPAKLDEFIDDKLVEVDGEVIRVSREGMLVVRNIAMAFDPQLDVKQGMYSKTI
jgi:oxygen-independent coproporphyrinogen III oxidase